MKFLWPLFFLGFAFACAPESGPAASTDASKSADASGSWPSDVAIYKNDKGEVLCPVMNEVVASPEKADGYMDYEGKRYYFCCGMCPGKFKESPATYAKK
ncbi:MAG: YHS domain-containing protein [Fimbriimonadaceae bacterium]|nr:YHS domain-containing protein [Fimbriimonadaceae bacterium]QYK59243.1 MAG: YHS domain-containing protein [Fimbriimonadaceae bacterium]